MFLQRGGKVKNLHEPRFPLDNVALPAKKLDRSDTTHSHPHPRDDKMKWYADIDIDRYPIFEYVISIGLFVFSVYGGASMAGIEWGLPGFSKRLWWHYLVVFLLFAFSFALLFNAECQRLVIVTNRDLIAHQISKFFCLFKNVQQKKLSSLISVAMTASGASTKVSLHSRWYGSQLSFIDCSTLVVLKCISEENAIRYNQMIMEVFRKNKLINNHNLE